MKSEVNPKGTRQVGQESKMDLRRQEQDGPKSESDLGELNSRWTEVQGGHIRGGHTEHTLCALHEAKSKSKSRDQAEVTRNRK